MTNHVGFLILQMDATCITSSWFRTLNLVLSTHLIKFKKIDLFLTTSEHQSFGSRSMCSRVSQTNVVNVQTSKLMLETSFSG